MPESPRPFPPIDAYAFLSDTHTTALVAPDGAVEWFCVPDAAGDAVAARLLDRNTGGPFTALIEAALNLDSAGDRDALHAWAERSPAART
ncbi:trehalase-like domain-containing protein [Micromonospora tulbaghiae]